MANIKEKIFAEIENIEKVLLELEKVKNLPQKELVVLIGIGAFLQNIYSGMENILKQLLLHGNVQIPTTSTWHKEVLNLAVEKKIISRNTSEQIGKYLFFRHFFIHSYGFLIDEERIKPLMEGISTAFSDFRKEIFEHIIAINKTN